MNILLETVGVLMFSWASWIVIQTIAEEWSSIQTAGRLVLLVAGVSVAVTLVSLCHMEMATTIVIVALVMAGVVVVGAIIIHFVWEDQ